MTNPITLLTPPCFEGSHLPLLRTLRGMYFHTAKQAKPLKITAFRALTSLYIMRKVYNCAGGMTAVLAVTTTAVHLAESERNFPRALIVSIGA